MDEELGNPLMPAGLLGLDQDEIKRQALGNAALQAGLAGLMASGPSLMPVSGAQILGQAGMVGTQAYQQGLQQAQQQAVQRQLQSTLMGGGGGQQDNKAVADRYRQAATMFAGSDPAKAKLYIEMADKLEGAAPKFTGSYGNVAAELYGNVDVSKLTPEQRANVAKVVQQRDIERSRAGAPAAPIVNVKYGESFGTGLAKEQVGTITNSFNSAQSAGQTIATVSSIQPIIDETFAGPGATVQIALTRIADKLGVAGKDATEKLRNTASLFKGAAQLELDAAEKFKGQGAITENERTLLRRAASVDPTELTQTEMKQVFNILNKSASARINSHNQFLDRFIETQPDAAKQLNLYRVAPPVPVRRIQ